jgi:hypothetical protein
MTHLGCGGNAYTLAQVYRPAGDYELKNYQPAAMGGAARGFGLQARWSENCFMLKDRR